MQPIVYNGYNYIHYGFHMSRFLLIDDTDVSLAFAKHLRHLREAAKMPDLHLYNQ
jgi:hypothetical protein